MGRPCRGLHRVAELQFFEISGLLLGCRKFVAGNRRDFAACGDCAGRIANSFPDSTRRRRRRRAMERAEQPADARFGRNAGASRQRHTGQQHRRRHGARRRRWPRARALKTQFPATSLGAQLQQVAQVIQVASYLGMSRQIFFCSLGGFDTHAGELEAHNTLYPQLSQAMAAFYAATQELGVAQNVTTFTESDFSRTFQPTTARRQRPCLGQPSPGGRRRGAGRPDLRRLPHFELGGPNDTDTRGRWIPRLRSINTARRWPPGLAFRTLRCPRYFRTSRTSDRRKLAS